ncbi:hypothetical protein BDV18DRAFT_7414 [Aspergillus unguis]
MARMSIIRRFPVLFASLLLSLPSTLAAPVLDGEGTIEARDDGGDVDAQWTWLHFEGCDSAQKKAIKQAHEDAVTMAEHVKEIDFGNDPGAMDFFGPAALNKDWQSNIQSVFEHISTFRLSDVWPGYRMNARCGAANDKKYQNRCSRPGLAAYQWNTKTDASNPNNAPFYNKADAVSNMHFCDIFFQYKKLDDAVDASKDVDNFMWRYDLSKYKNQAYIILHEFMHATVMTYEQNADRRIFDLQMQYYEFIPNDEDRGWKRKKVKVDVYQPYYCKILARTARKYIAQDGITMNADNYAQYALSKYVQSKLEGNQYPWLPLADRQAEDWYKRDGSLLVYNSDGTFGFNSGSITDDVSISADGTYEAHDLGDDEIIELPDQADTDTITPESDYPDDFNSQVQQWSTYVNRPSPTCAKSGDDAPSGRSSFTVADADARIKALCGNTGLYDTVFVHPIDVGTGQTKDGRGKALGVIDSSDINDGQDKLWLSASFAGSCVGMTPWPPTGDGLRDTDLCMDRFRAVVNSCDTSTTSEKYGGSLKDGCIVRQASHRVRREILTAVTYRLMKSWPWVRMRMPP